MGYSAQTNKWGRLYSIALRFSGTAATLVTTVLLTRKWDLASAGSFFIFYSGYRLVSGFTTSVFARKSVRDLAKFDPSEKPDFAIEIFNRQVFHVLLLNALFAIFALILTNQFSETFYLSAIGSLLWSITSLASYMAQGYFYANLSISLDFILVPFMFAAGLFLLPTHYSPVSIHLISLAISALVSSVFLYKKLNWHNFRIQRFELITEDLVFLGVKTLNVIQSNVIMLISPLIFSNSEVGVIGVLLRFFNVSNGILTGLASFYNPRFSKAYHQQDLGLLRKLFKDSQITSLLSYLPILIIFVLFPRQTLAFMKLPSDIGPLLVGIGLIGLINVATNLSGNLLMVTHQQNKALIAYTVSLILLLVSFPFLSTYIRLTGFVISFGLYQATKQGVLYIFGVRVIKGQ